MSLVEVRQRMSEIREAATLIRTQAGNTDPRHQEVDGQIREVRSKCPHIHTKTDVLPSAKGRILRNFCLDCGAQC